MAKWTTLPLDFPLQFNPYQDAFWRARRERICHPCGYEFTVDQSSPSNNCPKCDQRATRKYHRLTLIAGRRGGKTRAASIAAVEEAMVPNSIVWCCAPTVPKLHRYVLPALQQIIPENWVTSWNTEFGDIRLKNGSLIHLQTLEHPDQGRGQGIDAAWLDECSELTEEHWDVLRPSLTERKGVALFSTSPRSFDWVHDRLFAPAENGYYYGNDGSIDYSKPARGLWACRYSTAENPIIDHAELEEAKASMSATMYAQEYEADFVTFQGAVYGEELFPHHILSDDAVKKFIPEWPQIRPDRPILIGVDTGADHPFGAVKLVSTEKGFVVVDEYLERERSFIKHAQFLKSLGGWNGQQWSGVKPRFAINKNDKQASIELAQHGIYCAKAENDQVAGTERVKSWLHTNQLYFAASKCNKTIKQMQAYRWADNTSTDGQARKEKVFKKNDELPDAVRYALMIWPMLPTAPEVETPTRDLSILPAKMREDIAFMEKMEANIEEKPAQTVTEDFWQSSYNE
jgi:hypothetical protein